MPEISTPTLDGPAMDDPARNRPANLNVAEHLLRCQICPRKRTGRWHVLDTTRIFLKKARPIFQRFAIQQIRKANMSQPDLHQQSLLQAARDGDDDALGELIENFRPLLRAEAQRTLREVQGRIDASDIVQLTWWSAFRAFPRFSGDVDAFVGWLKKIHERNLQDAVRDQNAEKRAIRREAAPSAVLPNAPGRLTSPSQGVVRQEQQEHMNACLALLPAAQKEALWLRFYQGMSVAEIVGQMGRSETAVAGLLKRGLSSLRTMMNDQMRD